MKKKIEAELISLAHKILQLKETTTLPELQEHARQLYEKLAILNFAETHFSGPQPTIGTVRQVLEESLNSESKGIASDSELLRTAEKPKEEQKKTVPILSLAEENLSDNTNTPPVKDALSALQQDLKKELEKEVPEKPEIVIEKVNERVTDDLFVPITEVQEQEKPKSINDELKKGIHIGLNDRLAFIKHLFDGSATDYNRVLSQLNTLHSKSGAREFVKTMVKPDYNEWEGKKEYEDRFMELVFRKYEY